MPLAMTYDDGAFRPAAYCDHCGQESGPAGFIAWNFDATPGELRRQPVLVACAAECLEALAADRAGDGEWVGTPIDACLAALADHMGIDVPAVLEREAASSAAIHTRDQAPD